MDKLLNEYIEKFNDNFPMFLFRSAEEDEVKKIIKKCIDENKLYEADLNNEANY